MKSFAKKTIFRVKPYVPGKPIEEVKRELKLKRVIKLASNENPFGPSARVLKAIQSAALQVNRYPDGDCFHLRKALAKKLNVKPAQLIFGNGSDELIVFAARAFLKPGDEVLLAKPSFLIYSIASKLEGATLKEIPLKDFCYDLNAFEKALTRKTRIVFIGNPDNPSGKYISDKAMDKFIRCAGSKVLIFIDEAYFEYVEAQDYGRSLKLLKKYPNVFITRTFSKMYGLAGLRIGYGVGREGLIDILNRVREPFNVNIPAQAAALASLNDKAHFKNIKRLIRKQRNYLYSEFNRLKLDFVKSWTNFILIDVRKDARVVSKQLLKKGTIVRDMSVWGLPRYIRVTIGTPAENRQFIKQLEEIL